MRETLYRKCDRCGAFYLEGSYHICPSRKYDVYVQFEDYGKIYKRESYTRSAKKYGRGLMQVKEGCLVAIYDPRKKKWRSEAWFDGEYWISDDDDHYLFKSLEASAEKHMKSIEMMDVAIKASERRLSGENDHIIENG